MFNLFEPITPDSDSKTLRDLVIVAPATDTTTGAQIIADHKLKISNEGSLYD